MSKSHTRRKSKSQQPRPSSADPSPRDEQLRPLDADLEQEQEEQAEHRPGDEPEEEPLEVSEEVADTIRALEAERDEAVAGRQRALADFCNYQRRAAENERRALVSGAAEVAKAILPVLDNFDLALNQDTSKLTVEQLAAGVRLVRDELFKALEAHGLRLIEPEIGGAFDPNLHEAMLHQEAPDMEPNSVVQVLQVGYAMGDRVLRAAKVAVSPGGDD